MKSILSRKWFGIPVLVVVLGVVTILAAGGVLAATAFTFHGTGTVGSPAPPPTYDFTVDADTNGTPASNTTFTFTDTMVKGSTYTKTVYLKKTGTAPTFQVAVTSSGVSTGITIAVPSPVTLTASEATTPIAVPITFTVADSAPAGSVSWDINFNLVP